MRRLLAGLLLLTLAGCSAKQAPDEPFVLIDGRTLTSTDLRHGPVLVNFWATSCATCIQEIPDLVTLHKDYADKGLTIIGVAMPYDPPDLVVRFAQERQLPYPIALDVQARQVRAFGDIKATPINILIDRQGRIVERHIGRLNLADTQNKIEQLLKEG